MVVEKVSVDRVKNKLALLAQKKKGTVALPQRVQERPKLEEFGADEEEYQVHIQPSKRPKAAEPTVTPEQTEKQEEVKQEPEKIQPQKTNPENSEKAEDEDEEEGESEDEELALMKAMGLPVDFA